MSKDGNKGYMVYFDFTTFHRGGRIIGRSGQLSVNCEKELNISSDLEEIELVVSAYIYSQKPKWLIFTITIKSIVKQ